MNVFLHNKVYRLLSISRMLSSLGSYLYNIVFIVYAASLPFHQTAVYLPTLIPVLPTFFTVWVGMKADTTKNKSNWLIRISMVQTLLFFIVAYLIQDQQIIAFAVICLCNVLSDVLADYGAGLRMPMIQQHVAKEDLYAAYSFTHFSSYVCNILGQSLGLWLLMISRQNFTFVAVVNALSFLFSGLLLWTSKEHLTYPEVGDNQKKQPFFQQLRSLYETMEQIFQAAENGSFLRLVGSVLLMNALGGAIGGIYHFYFLRHQWFQLDYGTSIFLVEMLILLGAIAGSLVTKDYFSKLSFSRLLSINSLLFSVLALAHLLELPAFVSLLTLFLAAYIMGKSAPKLDALLMSELPSEILAQSNNLIGLLFTLALPVGVAIFSSLAASNLFFCWLVFFLLALFTLCLSGKK